MSEPITKNPFEHEAKRLADELKESAKSVEAWREKQAEHMGYVRAFMDHQQVINEGVQKDIGNIYKSIDERVSVVTSNVDTLRGDKNFVKGIWIALTAVAGIIVTLAGFIAWALDHFGKSQP
jgi:F0F1-type ATP synthase assembly protein I